MLFRLITSFKFTFMSFVIFHFFKLIPFNNIKNFIIDIIGKIKTALNDLPSIESKNKYFSIIIFLIGIFVYTSDSWKAVWVSRIKSLILWIGANIPLTIFISVLAAIIILIKVNYQAIVNRIESWYQQSFIHSINNLKTTMNRFENYFTCLSELPNGYSACLNRARTATSQPNLIGQTATELTERVALSNILQSSCTDSNLLQNFIKNNTTCSSKYMDPSTNPEIGFGCRNPNSANQILHYLDSSAPDINFREDTRENIFNTEDGPIIKCHDFIGAVNNYDQCRTMFNNLINPNNLNVPAEIDNITYSTVKGCNLDYSDEDRMNRITQATSNIGSQLYASGG